MTVWAIVAAGTLLLLIAAAVLLALWIRARRLHSAAAQALARAMEQLAEQLPLRDLKAAQDEAVKVREGIKRDIQLAQQATVRIVAAARAKAEEETAEIKQKAEQVLATANQFMKASHIQARQILDSAQAELQAVRSGNDRLVIQGHEQAAQLVERAQAQATALERNADALRAAVTALRNQAEGYGDNYILPAYSLLDDLAESYGFDRAGEALKKARAWTRLLVKQQRAATCNYIETDRRQTAARFVVDAFNGKVDSILSRTNADNYGKLMQQVRDAFALVNLNGAAFRDARITDEYLAARLGELKQGSIVSALRDRDREEQRRIREQIREEERAQREFEQSRREAERDEQAARQAMARAQEMLEKASAEQKAKYEHQLEELRLLLSEAEARNLRALSMAQQTKAGHVYIISNVGSFGEDVLKIGMTRRLEPQDRIRELGDASVPFPFDVHAMLYCDDAPALERELHHAFLMEQVNRVNPRKEFFRMQVSRIKALLEGKGFKCAWTLTAQAAEYRESLAVSAQIEADANALAEWERQQRLVDPVTIEPAAESKAA